MKKNTLRLIFMLSITSFYSCSRVYLDEHSIMQLSSLLGNYNLDCFRQPMNIGEIICYVENSPATIEMMGPLYDLLIDNRENLHIVANDTITMVYYKNYKLKNVLAIHSPQSVCDYEPSSSIRRRINLFDSNGTYLFDEKQITVLQNKLLETAHEYSQYGESPEEYKWPIVAEFIPKDGIRDICTSKVIDDNGNGYINEVMKILTDFCERNHYSRIIFPLKLKDPY